MKLLLIRMMGLGDVASIGIPAAKILRNRYPDAHITVLTYSAGGELIALTPGIDEMIVITPEEWPNDIGPAIQSFTAIANQLAANHYDQIYNLDTWFMPCFLGQFLKDAGCTLHGNHLSMSVNELLDRLKNRTLSRNYVDYPVLYMDSTFPNMQEWYKPWWQQHPEISYPHFYLNHCCGFNENIDITLKVKTDKSILEEANGRRIIALEWAGRVVHKQYPFGENLKSLLEENGYYVWRQFDGTTPMQLTLSRLAVSDLLISVPTAVQWLAHLVGCPSLIIPGPVPPSVLGPDAVIAKTQECQHCAQNTCIADLDFACLKIPPTQILRAVERFFENRASSPDKQISSS